MLSISLTIISALLQLLHCISTDESRLEIIKQGFQFTIFVDTWKVLKVLKYWYSSHNQAFRDDFIFNIFIFKSRDQTHNKYWLDMHSFAWIVQPKHHIGVCKKEGAQGGRGERKEQQEKTAAKIGKTYT